MRLEWYFIHQIVGEMPMIRLEERMMIDIMYKQGYGKKRIARELGISINTVRKYLREGGKPQYKKRELVPMKLDGYREYIKKRITDAHPHWIPATVIYREIKARGYQGGLSRLRAYMRSQKPEVKEEAVVRFETPPGQQMQIDWAEIRKGKNRLAAFIATLGYSRMAYVEFVDNERIESLMHCHESAFEYFGGVPLEILYDNMKTVIIGRDYYGEGKHRLHSGFWDFSKHYGFIPRVCRPYRPQTKGKVERFIHYLRYSFYYPLLGEYQSKSIVPDASLANQKVSTWLNTVANKRVHATLKEVPFDRFHKEQSCLQSLPCRYQGSRSCPKGENIVRSHSQTSKAGHEETILQHDLEIYDNLLN